MKQFFNKLNPYYQTSLFSAVLLVLINLVLMFMYFIGLSEITLGLSLGVLFALIIYLINGIIEDRQNEKRAYHLSVTFIFIRLILLALFLLGIGFLYYRGNVHAFNIFAVAGGYFLVEFIFIVIMMRKKDDLRY